jgi:hypothetical protein
LAEQLSLHAQIFAHQQAGVAPQLASEVAKEIAAIERHIVNLRQRIAAGEIHAGGG